MLVIKWCSLDGLPPRRLILFRNIGDGIIVEVGRMGVLSLGSVCGLGRDHFSISTHDLGFFGMSMVCCFGKCSIILR